MCPGNDSCKYDIWFHHTGLVVKDATVSIKFYEKNFGMQLIRSYCFKTGNYRSYFLESIKGQVAPSSQMPEEYLWNGKSGYLELLEVFGVDANPNNAVKKENVEPDFGFGHIAFDTPDVYAAQDELGKAGVKVLEKADEGKQKGVAYVSDPDGYCIALISRADDAKNQGPYKLSQAMYRIKDPKRTLDFYNNHMGLTTVCERKVGDVTEYALTKIPHGTDLPDPKSTEATEYAKSISEYMLVLQHNHNTENYIGPTKETPHISFTCHDLAAFVNELANQGVPIRKKFTEPDVSNLYTVLDPDGYEIILATENLTMGHYE